MKSLVYTRGPGLATTELPVCAGGGPVSTVGLLSLPLSGPVVDDQLGRLPQAAEVGEGLGEGRWVSQLSTVSVEFGQTVQEYVSVASPGDPPLPR